MKKLFVIRDDDLNYFSQPEDIKFWYEDIFAQNIPVSFSVIPFVKGNSDVYIGNMSEKNVEYPIGGNTELIKYLKDNQENIEIMQHGCTHETINGIFEFDRKKGITEDAKRGFEYLVKLFGDIKVFVAPHDSLSNQGIIAIETVGLNILRSKGSRNFLFRREYILNILKMIFHRFKNINRYKASAFPKVLNFGKHKEAYSYRLIKDRDLLKRWLRASSESGGVFVIVNHLHDRNEAEKDNLLFLIEEGKKLDFTFVKASELFI